MSKVIETKKDPMALAKEMNLLVTISDEEILCLKSMRSYHIKNIESEWKNINLINTKIFRVLDDKFEISK